MRIVSLVAVMLSFVVVTSCGPADTTPTENSQPTTNGSSASAQVTDPPAKPAKLTSRIKDSVDKGIRFVRTFEHAETGGISILSPEKFPPHPGLTAMAALVYMKSPRAYSLDDGPIVRRPLEWIVSLQKDDGALYQNDSATYCTSLAMIALVEADADRFKPVVARALSFLKRIQANEASGFRKGDKFFGGIGYGGDERPDLSNSHFGIEAARAAGLDPEDPYFKNAVVFLERCQNRSETNDQVWKDSEGGEVRPGNDGGAIYYPGESKAGIEELPDGTRVFKSYGSMSYALLKSYLFCDIDRRDPRVRDVARWCMQNFVLDRHPGFEAGESGNEPYQGLFYYYYTVAKALRVFGKNEFADQAGDTHDWRAELADQLLAMQEPDGSFHNKKNGRWQENFPVLTTLYALLALEECYASLKAK